MFIKRQLLWRPIRNMKTLIMESGVVIRNINSNNSVWSFLEIESSKYEIVFIGSLLSRQ